MYLCLSQLSVLMYSVLIAFAVVHVLKPGGWFKRKPFTCMPCMTGWLALILALLSGYTVESPILMLAGIGLGGLAGGLIMRYL